jgi:hypothetical protein
MSADIDIDVPDRSRILELIQHTPARQVVDGRHVNTILASTSQTFHKTLNMVVLPLIMRQQNSVATSKLTC